jgi:RNA polymerase sigma-70 factor (ECF subfamily)
VQAARRPVTGRARIAKLLARGMRRVPGLRLVQATVNGAPGAIALEDGRVIAAIAFTVDQDRIRAIDAVGNPDKLKLDRVGREVT